MEPEDFFKHMTGINPKSNYRISADGCCELMKLYANEEKRTEAIEFGYGCAFLINECPTIEDVETVYNRWNEKTKEETGTKSIL